MRIMVQVCGILMVGTLFFLCFLASSKPALSSPDARRYKAIFNFGDSLSDTGNYLLSGATAFSFIGNLPYGETFFHHPTGRCSDGRLVIDFIAEAFGLPLVPPYLGVATKGLKAETGVNFAVVGATALDASFFYAQGIGSSLLTNDSLSVQLGWFKSFKSSLCTTKQACDEHMKKSLFLVGEIGVNDYNFPLSAGASISQLRATVPLVVGAITNAVSVLIEEGAVELVVPGNVPMGCLAILLTLRHSPNPSDYDSRTGCLKAINSLAKYHNKYLEKELQILRQKYPHARIIYADYYSAIIPFFYYPKHFGFNGGTLRACCGGGGLYNFNASAWCAQIGSTACPDPSAFVNWDGIHLTESAYHYVAEGLLFHNLTSPPLITS